MNASLALLVPFIVAVALIAMLRRSRWAVRLADQPNERSLHSAPTPRLGGIGVMLAALPVAAIFGGAALATIAGLAGALAVVSLADDLRALPVALRLAAHAAIAGVGIAVIVPFAGADSPWEMLAFLGLLLAVVWMVNLFNFMDGADGLAGGMALAGFGALAIAAWLAGQWPLALASGAIASASAGFLCFNFPPAKVFLGDAGSIPLGFLAAALGIHGCVAGAWPPAFPLLVFSPFIVDASVTLAKRLARGEVVWRAHRSHYYQRLVLAGWSARRLALGAYALMACAASSAFLLLRSEPLVRCAILAIWGVAYAIALIVIDRRLSSGSSAAPPGRDSSGRSIG